LRYAPETEAVPATHKATPNLRMIVKGRSPSALKVRKRCKTHAATAVGTNVITHTASSMLWQTIMS
jgi:hypothetical protein